MSTGALKLRVFGAALLVFGGVQLIFGLIYADAAKREVAAQGSITRVIHGKGTTYEYAFPANGTNIQDDDSVCKTALSLRGCAEGASVLVYYDRENISENKLQEFHKASAEKFGLAGALGAGSLLLLGLSFAFGQTAPDSEEPEETEEETREYSDQPDVIHVVPDK